MAMDRKKKQKLVLQNVAEELKVLYTEYDRTKFNLSMWSFVAGSISIVSIISLIDAVQGLEGPALLVGGFLSFQKYWESKTRSNKRDSIKEKSIEKLKDNEEIILKLEHCFDMRNMKDKSERNQNVEIVLGLGKIALIDKTLEVIRYALQVFLLTLPYIYCLDSENRKTFSVTLLSLSLIWDVHDMRKYCPYGNGRVNELYNELMEMANQETEGSALFKSN